ncbi:MAG: phosphoribosyltransferase [Acidobacteria bacterium]|nr:phosphoribosyltransferase [Acidobacteriota bacterium]
MSEFVTFVDRVDAGQRLGAALRSFVPQEPIVLGLARGGVPVAAEVARLLNAPLDVLLVRKLGVPDQPELAFGAISEGGAKVLSTQLIRRLALSEAEMTAVEQRERTELGRRLVHYRAGRQPVSLIGRTVIIVDDGLATGATARVAVHVVRERGARAIVVAVPVASREARVAIGQIADVVVCLSTPEEFRAVGQWYENFEQTTDDEVTRLLDEHRVPPGAPLHAR